MREQIDRLVQSARALVGPEGKGGETFQRVRRALDLLRPEDIDLSERMRTLDRGGGWQTETIHQEQDLHLTLFIVPVGQSLPLHDHPSMTVLMRVMWGALRIRAMDWERRYPWSGLARLCYDGVWSGGSESLVVLPRQGNLHTLHALQDSAFLDLIMPPYDEAAGRRCGFYREIGTVKTDLGSRIHLAEAH